MGIDYGEKRIGLAITDEKKQFAFPYSVIENKSQIIKKIQEIIKKEAIKKIILGLPLDIAGRPNPVLKSVEKFKKNLEKVSGLSVEFENEIFTTKEAERIQGKHGKIDASAAALILKSYLAKN